MNQGDLATESETQTEKVFSQPDSGSVARLLKQGIFVYLRPYWKAQIVLALTVSLSVIFEIAFPLSLKFLVDSAIVPQDGRQLILILGGIGLLFAISSLGGVVQAYVRARFGSELLKDLRINLFTKLQDLPTSYFDRTQPGEITAFFAKELLTLQFALRDLIIKGFYAALKLGLTLAALLVLDWRLTLAVAIILPFTAILPRWTIKRSAVADYSDKYDDAKIASVVQDNVAAQFLIRAYGLRDLVVGKFAQLLGRGTKNGDIDGYAKFKKGFNSPVFLKSMVVVWTDFQNAIIYGLVIGIGSFLAIRGTLTIGAFSAFIVLLSQVGKVISSLSAFFRDLISAASSLERMERIINIPSNGTDSKTAVILPRLSKGIHFDQVGFSYTGQELQLKLNKLSIPVGRLTAIVGRSGAGKTTLLKLLMRFYDPLKGRILLDGYDLREANQASLHSQLGVVLQEIILLNTSVRENIRLVKPDASDAEVVAAAQAAEIHDTIMTLPEGYSSQVGEGGKLLSPGQRQRISLARALLRNPALLLLDEVTSALDPENEAAIIATLKKLARERTVVIVTHRLSTVVDADEVVVLDEGQVIEQGRHQLLLDCKGLYYRLWQLQTGFVVSANGRYAEVTGHRLGMIPLFKQLDGVLETLAGQFVSEYYEADHTVFAQGDRGDKFYIIVRGKVSVSSMTADNERIELNVLLDGDYFGEMALMKGSGLRSATVQTLLPTLFLTLERERFEKMMADFPALQRIVQQTALGRSLKMVNTLGRRKRAFSALHDKLE